MKMSPEQFARSQKLLDLQAELIKWFSDKNTNPIDAEAVMVMTVAQSMLVARPDASPDELAGWAYGAFLRVAQRIKEQQA